MTHFLANRTVLVVDDEVFIALDLADTVEQFGASVLGPANSLAAAFKLLESYLPDVALLDINVGAEQIWPLARQLKDNGCSIIFISANVHHDELAIEFPQSAVLGKPVSDAQLQRCLRSLV